MRFVGRAEECDAVDRVLAAARDGLSGTLVLLGEAGMGKTTLLDFALEAATGFRVARVAGIQSESEFGFAALHRLLLPFMAGMDALPDRQRQALRSAFGLDVGPPADRFLIGLAALTLLADRDDEPLLCVVDDAQWLDRESLDALAFVGRRLHADRVALLFAARSGTGTHLPFDGLPILPVEGLADDSALELLTQVVAGTLDTEVARRVVAETRGCPLALTELAVDLSSEQLAGAGVLPAPLPISGRLETHFLRHVRALPADTQTLLLIAAAEPSGDPALLWNAAAALGVAADAADAAEKAGLLVIHTGVEFRHPLIRSAVYGSAAPPERRRVHAALAALTDATTEPTRRVWHLAAAAVGPDESVAAELERCASDAHDRGRYAEEAALLSRAAELTSDSRLRATRMLAAAQTHLVAGAPHAAETLLQLAKPHLDGPLVNAQAQRLQAALNSFTLPNEIPSVLLAAATALEALDVRLSRATYVEAIEACLVSCQLTKGTTPIAVARAALAAPASPDPEPTLADIMLEGFATRLAVGFVNAVPMLREGVARLTTHDASASGFSRWAVLGNNAAAELWDVDAYRTMLQRMEHTERERGALDSLRITLGGLGHSEMWAGRFGSAEAYHSQASELALALGADAFVWEMLKVELFAWQGDDVKTRRTAKLLTGDLVKTSGAGVAVNLALIALTILEMAQGHYAEALASAWQLYEHDFPPHGNQVLAEIVEAGVRGGNQDAAEAAFARLSERAGASATPWALGLLARSEALLADDGTAEPSYQGAVAHLSATPVRTDLARAHLLYGEWLRRQKRRLDARAELKTAYDMFATMGANAFAERARVELAATGERARRRSVDTSNDLTPQEDQVARLASQGATNREIAERLYISDSTVDYHLRKVYRKLGLSSRRALRDVLA
jgi:DNA-binding CsgD family transcriptional regulator